MLWAAGLAEGCRHSLAILSPGGRRNPGPERRGLVPHSDRGRGAPHARSCESLGGAQNLDGVALRSWSPSVLRTDPGHSRVSPCANVFLTGFEKGLHANQALKAGCGIFNGTERCY